MNRSLTSRSSPCFLNYTFIVISRKLEGDRPGNFSLREPHSCSPPIGSQDHVDAVQQKENKDCTVRFNYDIRFAPQIQKVERNLPKDYSKSRGNSHQNGQNQPPLYALGVYRSGHSPVITPLVMWEVVHKTNQAGYYCIRKDEVDDRFEEKRELGQHVDQTKDHNSGHLPECCQRFLLASGAQCSTYPSNEDDSVFLRLPLLRKRKHEENDQDHNKNGQGTEGQGKSNLSKRSGIPR